MKKSGFIHIPLLIIALLGASASVYLIQQKTHFLSQSFVSKDVLQLFSNQSDVTQNTDRTITYQLPKSTPAANNSNGSLVSAFQRLLQRRTAQPSNSPLPTQASILLAPTPTPITSVIPTPAPVSTPTPVPTTVQSTSTSTPAKPVCTILVMPSSTGTAPYQASVCVGNNSSPYQAVQQEFVDYDGDGNWDYQGPSYGCHSYTFQNPGTYFPKTKITGTSGQESDICQTTVTISADNLASTPTPTPQAKITASSCSSVTVEGDATYVATYTDQDGYPFSIYSIRSGGTAKLTAQTTPLGAYINWKITNTSAYLPSGGTLTVDPNDYTVVNFTAPNNPTNEDQGTYVRGDYSEYPDPWKHCPSVDFAVKPG